MPRRPRAGAAAVDTSVTVGTLTLPNPVMTAAGTAGHGDELGRYLDLGRLGAVVVKSLSGGPWVGNPAPRVHETPAGMLNSVGLQNPGLPHWRDHELPPLLAAGARVVVSIWGRSVEEYAEVAAMAGGLPDGVVAVEVNLSCPNLAGKSIFAHDAAASAEVIRSVSSRAGRPVWAKLSPNTDRLVEVAAAVGEAGAAAVTLTNTLLGLAIDPATRRPRLGGGGGGLSGPAMHAVAVRAVYDCRVSLPELPIVGVGGIASGSDAVEMLLAGAHAVQVGTASFADPRAAETVLDEIVEWCMSNGVDTVSELTGGAHV
jgi:dihydroorotate dehydrogenase (NAD+) catalytic subunit